MRIGVIGPGAMGILFSIFLKRAGCDVTLVDRDPSRAALLNQSGLTLEMGGETLRERVPVITPHAAQPQFNLMILTVKAPATREAAATAKALLLDGGLALTLQNGIGGGDILAGELGADRVLLGVTSQGATLLSPGVIRYGGSGGTTIGNFNQTSPHREEVVELFQSAGLAAYWTGDIQTSIWKKLSANCGINAITALTFAKNRVIAENPYASALCRGAVLETARVAKAMGVDLGDPEELSDWVIEVARKTGANRSSMGQDVDRGRVTEIDFINGAVARMGQRAGIPTPVNDTLAKLVLVLEEIRETKGE